MPAESTDRARLLLIEDDPKLGRMTQQVLTESYGVTLVTDGARELGQAPVLSGTERRESATPTMSLKYSLSVWLETAIAQA